MLAKVVGNAVRANRARGRHSVSRSFDVCDAMFDLADGCQIFVDLSAIVDAHAIAKLPRIVEHEVENALAVLLTPGALGRCFFARPRSEKPVEGRAWD